MQIDASDAPLRLKYKLDQQDKLEMQKNQYENLCGMQIILFAAHDNTKDLGNTNDAFHDSTFINR